MTFRSSRALLTGSIAFALLMSVNGCSSQPRPLGQCAFDGAVVGGMTGAAAGVGIAYLDPGHGHPGTDKLAATMGGGGAVGAIIGAALGHELCDPVVGPPPPPPVMAAAPPPPPPPAPAPPHHEKLVLRGVHFDFNKAKIRPGDAATLDEAVE